MNLITHIALCERPELDVLKTCIDEVLAAGARSLIILACEQDGWTAETLNPLLLRLDVPLMGGVFPNVIYRAECLNQGTLVVGLAIRPTMLVLENLSDGEIAIEEQLVENSIRLTKARSLITIVDGLAQNLERLLESLYSLSGVNLKIVGGGAGSLDFVQKPCLFTNQGMLCDAAIIAALPVDFHSCVMHGWEVLDGPYLVTSSKGNMLETLNYAPAFELYQTQVEKHSGLRFSEHDFFSIAKTYPLGIESIDGEILVRDPIQRSGNALLCVGEVPQNSTIYILKGDAGQLIASAAMAANTARMSYDLANDNQQKPHTTLLFDCISRALFLEQEFDQELQAIADKMGNNGELFGTLSLGEISSSRYGPIELLNKSTVVAVY